MRARTWALGCLFVPVWAVLILMALATLMSVPQYGEWADQAADEIAHLREQGEATLTFQRRHKRWPLTHEILCDYQANCEAPVVYFFTLWLEERPDEAMILSYRPIYPPIGGLPPSLTYTLNLSTGEVNHAGLTSVRGWVLRGLFWDVVLVGAALAPLIFLAARAIRGR